MAAKQNMSATQLPIEADELHQDEVDAFIARNREGLVASIAEAQEEVARGITASRTIDQIIADGRKRLGGG